MSCILACLTDTLVGRNTDLLGICDAEINNTGCRIERTGLPWKKSLRINYSSHIILQIRHIINRDRILQWWYVNSGMETQHWHQQILQISWYCNKVLRPKSIKQLVFNSSNMKSERKAYLHIRKTKKTSSCQNTQQTQYTSLYQPVTWLRQNCSY